MNVYFCTMKAPHLSGIFLIGLATIGLLSNCNSEAKKVTAPATHLAGVTSDSAVVEVELVRNNGDIALDDEVVATVNHDAVCAGACINDARCASECVDLCL